MRISIIYDQYYSRPLECSHVRFMFVFPFDMLDSLPKSTADCGCSVFVGHLSVPAHQHQNKTTVWQPLRKENDLEKFWSS